MEDKTLIIIDPNNEEGDIELFKLLRKSEYKFSTGLYSNNGKKCIWYSTNKENFGDLRDPYYGGALLMCKYKLLRGNHFECNCADVDLPLIEDVWKALEEEVEE